MGRERNAVLKLLPHALLDRPQRGCKGIRFVADLSQLLALRLHGAAAAIDGAATLDIAALSATASAC